MPVLSIWQPQAQNILIWQISSSNILLCEAFHSCSTSSVSTNPVSICLVEFSFLSYLQSFTGIIYLTRFCLFCDLISLFSPRSRGEKLFLLMIKCRQHRHPTLSFACRLTLFPHANTVSVCGRLPRCKACIRDWGWYTDVTPLGSAKRPYCHHWIIWNTLTLKAIVHIFEVWGYVEGYKRCIPCCRKLFE